MRHTIHVRQCWIGRPAYSLIETIIVIGVLGLLISLLMPAVQDVRQAAAKASCANNLKQIGLAIHHFESAHSRLPPGVSQPGAPESLLSWLALTLPYVEQSNLWEISVKACAETPITYENPPHVGYATVVRLFVCPADGRLAAPLVTPTGDRAAFGSYVGVKGSYTRNGFQPGVLGNTPGPRFTDILDGTAATLLVGERLPPDSLQAGRWYSDRYVLEPHGGPDTLMGMPQPKAVTGDIQCQLAASVFGPGVTSNPCDRYHYWSLHRGGANFIFADASVHFVRYSASSVLPLLATMAGGEIAFLPE